MSLSINRIFIFDEEGPNAVSPPETILEMYPETAETTSMMAADGGCCLPCSRHLDLKTGMSGRMLIMREIGMNPKLQRCASSLSQVRLVIGRSRTGMWLDLDCANFVWAARKQPIPQATSLDLEVDGNMRYSWRRRVWDLLLRMGLLRRAVTSI